VIQKPLESFGLLITCLMEFRHCTTKLRLVLRWGISYFVACIFPTIHRCLLKHALSESGMKAIKNTKCLFIVQKTLLSQNMAGNLFEVLRLTDDEETIRRHQACGHIYTPIKVCRISAIYV